MPNLANLRNLLKERGKSEELSKNTGISSGNISDWKSGRSKPGLNSLIKIADYFQCSVDYLLNRTNIRELNINPIIIYRFPVFYQSAAAGIGKLSQTDDYQMEEFKLKNVPKKAVFGMYIEGHSMETIIYENDVILIDPSENEPSSLDDEIVVARFGEELICKRLSVNEDHQTYDFNSENSDDKDKGRYNQKQSNFTLVGRVVKIIHAHELGNGLISYSED